MDRVFVIGIVLFMAVSFVVAMYIALVMKSTEVKENQMKRAIVKDSGGNKWIFCPECGKRVAVIPEGGKADVPEICSHCGSDIWYEEDTDEGMGIIPN